MQENLYKHFRSERHSHFHDNVSVILIDKNDGSNLLKEKHTGCKPLKL